MILCALAIVLPLAFASWTLVEKPALSLKRAFKRVPVQKESA